MKIHKYTPISPIEEQLLPNYYWHDEAPIFNKDLIDEIVSFHQVDIMVTHTAPSFCELLSKDGLVNWVMNDELLLYDVQKERETIDAIFDKMKESHQTLTHWYYGHFHQSWHSSIQGVLFKMLDIMEFAEVI